MNGLIMIRHAPTAENAKEIFMGRLDSPCPPESLDAAKAVGVKLVVPNAAAVYSSPLQRCRNTAEMLFPKTTIKLDARLAERDLGKWSGNKKEDVRTAFPEAFLPTGRMDPNFTPPGGEPLPEFCRRVSHFLRDCVRITRASDTLVVVSHNGVIRIVRHLVEGLPLSTLFAESEKHLLPVQFSWQSILSKTFEQRTEAILQACAGK